MIGVRSDTRDPSSIRRPCERWKNTRSLSGGRQRRRRWAAAVSITMTAAEVVPGTVALVNHRAAARERCATSIFDLSRRGTREIEDEERKRNREGGETKI